MGITRELYETISTIVDDKIKDIKIRREDFDALHDDLRGVSHTVDGIAKTQNEVEARVGRLEAVMIELAEAQKHTYISVAELREAQTRTELKLGELAEAQKRTDISVAELREAQTRTERSLAELAESHKLLVSAVHGLKVQVGRLSDTIGFGLEDIAIVMIPGYLQRHHHIAVEFRKKLIRLPNKQEIEIDLYGEGKKEGQPIIVIGETKTRVKKGDVIKFDKRTQPLVQHFKEKNLAVLKTMLGYWVHPDAETEAQARDMIVIASYQR